MGLWYGLLLLGKWAVRPTWQLEETAASAHVNLRSSELFPPSWGDQVTGRRMESDCTPTTPAAVSPGVNGGLTVEECEKMIQKSLRSTHNYFCLLLCLISGFRVSQFFFSFFLFHCLAPMVKFMKENLEKSGCAIGNKFIRAINCQAKISGGYVRGEGVRICFFFYQMKCIEVFRLCEFESNTSIDLRFQFTHEVLFFF